MLSKRLVVTGAVLVSATVATAGAYASASSTPADSDPVYLVSSLQGRNEVPGAEGAVNDPDGRAVEVLTIRGSKVSFDVRWQGLAAPAARYAGSCTGSASRYGRAGRPSTPPPSSRARRSTPAPSRPTARSPSPRTTSRRSSRAASGTRSYARSTGRRSGSRRTAAR